MTTLRELRQGCLLHVLVALAILGRPATKTEIADEIGFAGDAVEDACRILSRPCHNLTIALPNGRWPLWALTPSSKRLLRQAADNDYVSMTPLPAESGVHSPTATTVLMIKDHLVDNLPAEKLTPLPAESLPHKVETFGPNVSFADDTARVLCKLGGVTYPVALDAVQTALEQGDTQADILATIEQQSGFIAAHIPEHIGAIGLTIAHNLKSGDTT